MNTPAFTLALWKSGLISTSEALEALESINVHGGFDEHGYTGYDYTNQEWVTA